MAQLRSARKGFQVTPVQDIETAVGKHNGFAQQLPATGHAGHFVPVNDFLQDAFR
jgi:hypothetical protein